MRITKIFIVTLFLFIICGLHGQAFEGMITLHISTKPSYRSTATIKGNKSMLDVKVDSTTNFKIIKDHAAGSTVLLKNKKELKYGFRTSEIEEYTPHDPGTGQKKYFTIEVSDQQKVIGGYNYTKVNLTGTDIVAEAWITKDLDFPLTKYFPEFLSGDLTPEIYDFRKAADMEGFVAEYTEKVTDGDELTFSLSVEPKEISIDVFSTNEYLVLDENSMKRLYVEGQSDPAKKKQFDEFMQLFGNK